MLLCLTVDASGGDNDSLGPEAEASQFGYNSWSLLPSVLLMVSNSGLEVEFIRTAKLE